MKLRALALAAVLLLAGMRPASGQEVSITTRLSPAAIQIGEYAVIDMVIRTNDLPHTLLTIPREGQMGQAEMISFQVTDTVPLTRTVSQLNARMIVTSFDEGLVQLPAFGVSVGEQSYYSDPLYLKVSVPEVDTTQPERYYGLKPPEAVRLSWWEWLLLCLLHPVTWIVLGVLLLLGGFLWYRRYRRNRPEPEPVRPEPPTPVELFDRRLALLRDGAFVRQADQIVYYDGLLEALRDYLDAARGVESEGFTARDLWLLLQRAPYSLPPDLLRPWVIHSEWIRFADAQARPEWQAEDAGLLTEAVHRLEASAPVAEQERKEGSPV